jgi:hypothetical protein
LGLDIYGHLVKKVRSSKEEPLKSIKEYSTIADERAKARFHEFAVASLKRLEEVKDEVEKYREVYNDVFSHMADFTQYSFEYERMLKEPNNVSVVKDFFKDFEDDYYAEEDVYFRKVNFVYNFFSDKLENECCFADKSDIEELISRCDKVLADHSLAEELLPTTSGFFFGSTDYDEWYFKDVEDCKKQMENLLSKYDDETDVIYFIMSW